ncbi:MAG: Rrf2 family transcriptional regulator [Calditrichaeota bacterium]|nr:Rrf2 family transcriptional regulator [Calditrichota bacterium]
MLRLSKKTEYALIALKEIALNSGVNVTTVREISESHQIPRDLLAKILQSLKREKIVRSVQGAKGGYSLSTPIDEITLLRLIEILEGPAGLIECAIPDSKHCKKAEVCSIRDQLLKLNDQMLALLQGTTLRQFLFNGLSVAVN